VLPGGVKIAGEIILIHAERYANGMKFLNNDDDFYNDENNKKKI
jgi:hypothetical protein